MSFYGGGGPLRMFDFCFIFHLLVYLISFKNFGFFFCLFKIRFHFKFLFLLHALLNLKFSKDYDIRKGIEIQIIFKSYKHILLYQIRDLLRLISDESLQSLDCLLSNKSIYSINDLYMYFRPK